MSRLVHLYPRTWRDRYEAELREALASRPITWRDRRGLLRGALDAWIHPELADPPDVAILALAGGGGIPVGATAPLPWIAFLGAVAMTSFLFVAALVRFRESTFWGDEHIPSTLSIVGTLAFGGALWRVGAGRVLARLGAIVMVVGTLVLAAKGWAFDQLIGAIPLMVGGAIAGVGGLVERRPGRLTGAALMGLTLVAATFWEDRTHLGRITALLWLGVALVAGRLALTQIRVPRALLAGLLAAGVAGAVMIGLVATDPWSRHDGYALGCHIERSACVEQADRLAVAMRAHFAGERVLAIELRADGKVWACFTWSGPGGSPVCRLGPDDGWPTTLPAGTF